MITESSGQENKKQRRYAGGGGRSGKRLYWRMQVDGIDGETSIFTGVVRLALFPLFRLLFTVACSRKGALLIKCDLCYNSLTINIFRLSSINYLSYLFLGYISAFCELISYGGIVREVKSFFNSFVNVSLFT